MVRVARSTGAMTLDDLRTIVEALEATEEQANGVGELVSCRIVIQFESTQVTCTYVKSERDWEVRAS